MVVGSSGIFVVEGGKGYPLVKLLGADYGAEICSSNGMPDGNIYDNLEGPPLREYTFGS